MKRPVHALTACFLLKCRFVGHQRLCPLFSRAANAPGVAERKTNSAYSLIYALLLVFAHLFTELFAVHRKRGRLRMRHAAVHYG
jgi:hypothetical protein